MQIFARFRRLSEAVKHEYGDRLITSDPLETVKKESGEFVAFLPGRGRVAACKTAELKEIAADASGVALVLEDPIGEHSDVILSWPEMTRILALGAEIRDAFAQAKGKRPEVAWVNVPETPCSMCSDPARRAVRVEGGGEGENRLIEFCPACEEFYVQELATAASIADSHNLDAVPPFSACAIHVPILRAGNAFWCAGGHVYCRG